MVEWGKNKSYLCPPEKDFFSPCSIRRYPTTHMLLWTCQIHRTLVKNRQQKRRASTKKEPSWFCIKHLSNMVQGHGDRSRKHSHGTTADLHDLLSLYLWMFYHARPAERSGEDVDIILARLKNAKAFEHFHPSLLHQICLCGFYECLEKGITCTPTCRPPQCCSPHMTTASVCQIDSIALLFQCIARETSAPAGMPSSLVRWTSKFQRPPTIR